MLNKRSTASANEERFYNKLAGSSGTTKKAALYAYNKMQVICRYSMMTYRPDIPRIPLWLLFLAIVPGLVGMFHLFGLPIGFGLMIYGQNILNFSEQLFAGDWCPQWADKMNGGVGSPALLFYSPLPQYIGSFFIALLGKSKSGTDAVYATCMLGHVGFVFGMRQWLMQHFVPKETEAALQFTIIAPIFVFLYFYNCNHALFLYLAFAAWTLAFVSKWQRSDDSRWLGLSVLCSTGALLSHPLYYMIFAPFALGYSVLFCKCGAARIQALIAAVIPLGLAAFFLLPAWLSTPDYLFKEAYLSGWLSYRNNFLNGDVLIILAMYLPFWGIALLALICFRQLNGRERYYLFCIGVILFMMTTLSLPLWERISFLQSLQFPSRFYEVFILFIIPLSIAVLRAFPTASKIIYNSMCALYYPHLIAAIIAFYTYSYDAATSIKIEQLRPNPWNQFLTVENAEMVAAQKTQDFTQPSIKALFPLLEKYQNYPLVSFLSGQGNADTHAWSSKETMFITHITSAEAQLRLRQVYAPGWQAFEGGALLPLKPGKPEGFIEMTLPQGTHHVRLSFVPKGYEMGKQISLVTLAGLFIFLASIFFMNKRKA